MKTHFLTIREYNSIPRTGDYLEETAARWLAGRIKAYWRNRGKAVDVQVVPAYASASPTDSESAIFCIRSNMVGGRPA